MGHQRGDWGNQEGSPRNPLYRYLQTPPPLYRPPQTTATKQVSVNCVASSSRNPPLAGTAPRPPPFPHSLLFQKDWVFHERNTAGVTMATGSRTQQVPRTFGGGIDKTVSENSIRAKRGGGRGGLMLKKERQNSGVNLEEYLCGMCKKSASSSERRRLSRIL